MDEWITLKAVVHDSEANFHINDEKEPRLVMQDLIHGPDSRGRIGLFVDIGTEAFFKDLRVTFED